MDGAKKIDTGILQGKRMICLDNMNEDELWIGCAGAKIFKYQTEGRKTNTNNSKEKQLIKIVLNGFVGGHSGKDISKERGNPIKEMGAFLKILYKKYGIFIEKHIWRKKSKCNT